MLVAALACAFLAFIALVYYIQTASVVALVSLFVAAGLGLVLFVADWILASNRK